MNRKAVSLALFVTLICSFGLANDLTAADEEEQAASDGKTSVELVSSNAEAKSITVKTKVHFGRGPESRKQMRCGERPAVPRGRVPRVAKLMALAIKFEQMVRDCEVTDYAELARLGHVTRARMTQIMNLNFLAPDIQEELLHLPLVERGHDPLLVLDIQHIAAEQSWRRQHRLWDEIRSTLLTCGRVGKTVKRGLDNPTLP